jgi:hypothetical protein
VYLKEGYSDAFLEQCRRMGCGGKDTTMNYMNCLTSQILGIRRTGRPKLRWEDDVIQDIKTLGVKNWRNLAMEKESWQKLLRKARAHVGLSSQ